MKRRRIKSLKLPLIVVAFVVMLNLVGISYAYWNDNLLVTTLMSTGNIGAEFCDKYSLEDKTGEGELTVRFEDKPFEENSIMIIEGKVDTDFKAFLHYCIKNTGSIPIKFAGHNGTIPVQADWLEEKDKELKVHLNQQAGLLKPADKFYSETGNPKLHLDAKNREPGIYKFEIELPFTQWNMSVGSSSWEKKLVIKGEIEIIESEKNKTTNAQKQNDNIKDTKIPKDYTGEEEIKNLDQENVLPNESVNKETPLEAPNSN